MKIWDEEYETMPINDLEQLQLERLQQTLYRVYRHGVPFYRKSFDESGFEPGDIESLDDLKRLPFTTRDDLKSSYPYKMFAVKLSDVVRIHYASGDAGIVGYTKKDLENWSNLVARALCSSGIDENDTIQITHPYGLYPGAFGYHYAAELLGASVIPASTANTKKQIKIMQDYLTTAIVCTPSYALRLIYEFEKEGINPNVLSLKHAILGSEPWTDEMREEIEEGLSISTSFNYGVASIFGPGVASECREKRGLHIFMDHFISEIIDPKTGKSLPNGKEGELVLTTLTRDAFPIIRYRTGDITKIYPDKEKCTCGRTHLKIEPVKRRLDDLIIFEGINIYPNQIEEILREVLGNKPKFKIDTIKKDGKDHMIINIEISKSFFYDEMKVQRNLIKDIELKINRDLGIVASIKLIEQKRA